MEYIGIGIVIAVSIAAVIIIYTKFTKCENIPSGDLVSATSIVTGGKPLLRYTSKGFPLIFPGFGACIGILCRIRNILNFLKLIGRLLADRALKIRCNRAFVNVTADCAFPFFRSLFFQFFIELNVL